MTKLKQATSQEIQYVTTSTTECNAFNYTQKELLSHAQQSRNDCRSNPVIRFTEFTSSHVLTKKFSIVDEKISKQAAANMYSGHAKTVTCRFKEFADKLNVAITNQAFGYGINPYADCINITTHSKQSKEKGVYARTKENFSYANGSGLLMLDHDPDGIGADYNSAADMIAVLAEIMPELDNAAYIARGSVSSGVCIAGEQPTQDTRFHIYIPVENASDIQRFGEVLFNRLILNGHAHIRLSKDGKQLLRTCIDAAVFSPERLDFVAPPIVGNGLVFYPPKTTIQDGGVLDTTILKSLDVIAKRRYFCESLFWASQPKQAAKT